MFFGSLSFVVAHGGSPPPKAARAHLGTTALSLRPGGGARLPPPPALIPQGFTPAFLGWGFADGAVRARVEVAGDSMPGEEGAEWTLVLSKQEKREQAVLGDGTGTLWRAARLQALGHAISIRVDTHPVPLHAPQTCIASSRNCGPATDASPATTSSPSAATRSSASSAGARATVDETARPKRGLLVPVQLQLHLRIQLKLRQLVLSRSRYLLPRNSPRRLLL